jgi:hypothetical protein
MIIVRLLSPEPVGWYQHHQLYSGLGADIVMGSITLIDLVCYRARGVVRAWVDLDVRFWDACVLTFFGAGILSLQPEAPCNRNGPWWNNLPHQRQKS